MGSFLPLWVSFWVSFIILGVLWGSFWTSVGVLFGSLGRPGWGPFDFVDFGRFARHQNLTEKLFGQRGRDPRDPHGGPRRRLGVETDAPGATFEVQMLKHHWFLALLDVLMLKH